MADEEVKFSPCSQMDLQSAATKAAMEQARQMEARGEPAGSKYNLIRQQETDRYRAFGKHMEAQGKCDPMSFDELAAAVEEFSKQA